MNAQTQTTETRKTGVSFQSKSKYYFEREVKPVNIAGHEVTTAAQAMTLIGYGDSHSIPLRSLDYNVKCEDFKDLMACITIIDSYNEFDAARIKKAAVWELNLQHYLNDNNANNGKCLFDFHIAREGSPAFYVNWNQKYSCKIIADREPIEASEPGENLFWKEYTVEDFKASMSKLAASIGADEFDIKEQYTYEDGQKSYEARFWFD